MFPPIKHVSFQQQLPLSAALICFSCDDRLRCSKQTQTRRVWSTRRQMSHVRDEISSKPEIDSQSQTLNIEHAICQSS